jgi:hypothetical protein
MGILRATATRYVLTIMLSVYAVLQMAGHPDPESLGSYLCQDNGKCNCPFLA